MATARFLPHVPSKLTANPTGQWQRHLFSSTGPLETTTRGATTRAVLCRFMLHLSRTLRTVQTLPQHAGPIVCELDALVVRAEEKVAKYDARCRATAALLMYFEEVRPPSTLLLRFRGPRAGRSVVMSGRTRQGRTQERYTGTYADLLFCPFCPCLVVAPGLMGRVRQLGPESANSDPSLGYGVGSTSGSGCTDT